jgi:chromosome segregation ATPase
VAELERPYSRSQFNRALIANAALSPFNVLLLAGMLVAGLLLDVFLIVLPVALVVYGIAAARTYLDEDEASKVLQRERGRRRSQLERGRIDPGTLSPPIRQLVEAGRARESRIEEAIERADLPYSEVSDEVDRFIAAMDGSAARAELLYEALAESPPDVVEDRLRQAEADPAKSQLAAALQSQLAVLRRMEGQLQRFYDEMQRMLVELDTVRASLVSVSASSEAANQEKLAAEVRGLRDELGAVAEGMSEAYESPAQPAG